ncbi:ribosomal RNA-processing protein 7 homolog A [Athalia rosae]|uniref:ribosomal RNA-processing protein 7 homolog A n=1 Tax=Athalia rosae TaxID=37344 RepID=UPI002033F20A|nr:ribosomal RNA-processing protein 7 homolog A [Athalia rosae]
MTVNKQKNNGFKVIWIRYEDQGLDRHQIFVKEHSLRRQQAEYPKGRTLFILNIPPYVVAESLQRAFSTSCGKVQSVSFALRSDQSLNGFKVCYVVFDQEAGLDKALLLRENYVLTLHSPETSINGISKWSKEYNNSVCNEKETQNEIEEYMHKYDQGITDRLMQENTKGENEGDGWVTVSGQKKRGQRAIIRTESAIGKIRQKQAASNKKKELLHFYTFQIRESKKQNLAELRKKFEQDKDKLQLLKTKRTFKPF